jgi:ribosomal protein L37AE/L43A
MGKEINITVNASLGGECPKCKKGSLLPIPTAEGAPFGKWICSNCDYELTRD